MLTPAGEIVHSLDRVTVSARRIHAYTRDIMYPHSVLCTIKWDKISVKVKWHHGYSTGLTFRGHYNYSTTQVVHKPQKHNPKLAGHYHVVIMNHNLPS